MIPNIECSDELLLGILNQDSGGLTELGLQHLDNCEHCQARIEELAANEQQWTLAREGLCSRVEGGRDVGNDFQNPTRFHPTAEHSSDWTDTMAKQLLQPPSHPEMLGRLGRYEIERLVGSGGMGVVFKAYDSELHRSVAIKMLAPHLSGSRSARERFAREARAAAAIVNDHVVPIHNVETEHATPYLVMQYIAGDSLQARVDRDGSLDVCEILRIGMQVAIGLAAAHAQGLIHRDVKPSNIMLDENVARALLTDFGLARTQDEACLTRSGFHPGTPHYMSPEQVRGEELDGRSDLFSLGCVLYALCTGHPPYRADSGYAVMRRITDEQPRSIREQNPLIPEWLERVVMRLLEKDREARFQSAEELSQILEQCLAHVQKPATEPLPQAVVPKASFFDRGRIRNWILGGMASAFLFFAGVFIVLETNKGTITIKSEADNVPIRIKRSDKVVDEMVVSRTGKSVRLAAGEYVIEFDGDSEDLVVEGGSVALVRGETKTLQIVYKKSDGPESRLSKGTPTRENYEKAIEENERLVAINNTEYVRKLAVEHSKMGDWFLSEGNGAESRKYYEKSLEVTERLLASAPENSEYSQNLATAYDKLAGLFLSQGNGAKGDEYANKAREIRKRLASIAKSAMSESTSTEKDKRVLSAISRLDAPAKITVDEELGVVTLKGSRDDVARTNRILEMIRKLANKQSLSMFDETPASESTTPVKDNRVLSAISHLDAPATIAVDEEHGIATVKGSKADVEKTIRTIEMICRVADENPSTPIDWSKLNTEVPVVTSELAATVNEFNFNQKNWWAAANYPLLTEDEVCAALWWQANHTNISPELRKEFLAIVLNRKLPTGWSIRLSKIQGEMRERVLQGTTLLQSNSIEINLMRGDQVASTIRSKFVGTNHPSRDQSTSPLADAIANFNKERAGVEPPLTLAETLAALATLWAKEPDRRQELSGLSEEAVSKLKTLADHLTMDGITIDSSLRDHKVGESKFLTWKIDLAVMSDSGIGWAETFPIRKRFIQVESDRISARMKEPTALHTYKTPSPEVDFSKPKATMSTVASDLASVVNDFNRVHTELLRSSNSPSLTEDELVASLWWQSRQSDLTEELKEFAREIALTRTLPKGWSLGLRLTKWGNDKFWETPEQTKSIEIELKRGDGNLISIRSQYVASRLITSLTYRPDTPLRSAIAKFNSQYTTSEPSVTYDEVVAAISTLMENSPSELASSHGLTEKSIQALRQVAMTHEMADFTFERLQSLELPDGDKFATWTVRLTSPERDHDGKTQSFEIRKRFIKVESDRILAGMNARTALQTDKKPVPLLDFSKVKISTFESDLTAAVEEFNQLHSEKLRASNSPPLTVDELVASLWWQYSQSELRDEISETVKEIVITRKLPPGWFIKLNSRGWELPQLWWQEKDFSSSAIQINLIGKKGLAATIRNQFVSSDATSIQPPESQLKTAIEVFNKSHSEEPRLTLDEILAALSTLWGKQSWYSSDELKPSTMAALIAVMDRQVMNGVKIELLRSYETGDDRFSVWSIRLVVQDEQDGSTQAFTIRERFQKVNSFSDEMIHWGKPSDAGLQAGFRFKPAQTRYLAGQVVDVEFFYRTIHGKGLEATLPNAFHFNKIEIDLNRADGKQRLSVEHDREKIIGGWRVEGIGEQPTLFKNRKIRFVDSPEEVTIAREVSDDWTTNVMLPINTKCDIAFDVPDFAEPSKKSASLLTGGTQISILNAGDEKRPPANPLDSKTIPTLSYESFLQTELDSVKLKYNQGVASKEEVLKAEMKLVEAKIRTAEAESIASLPALLKEREGILQKAFLAAKNNYESGLIGIDEFSQVVTELVDAKFASRIATEGIAGSLDSVSPNDVSIMLIEEFFVKQKALGGDHPELLQLRDNVLKLRFDHTFDEVGIQKRLFELNRERQQLLKTRSEGHPSLGENLLRQQAVTSLRSGSFPKMLKMLVETDPRRANLLPQEWKGKWLVESATNGDGSLLDVAKGSKLSISNSTLDWQWGEIACEYYLVNGVTVNGQQSLVNLHWRSESPSMQGGAAIGDIQWVVEFRDNKLWIVRLDQPESPVSDSVDIIRPGHSRFVLKREEPDSLSDDTVQAKQKIELGNQTEQEQVTNVRRIPFPKEMQGVWRIKEAFYSMGKPNERLTLEKRENQIVTFSESTMSKMSDSHWYLSYLDQSKLPMEVDLSAWPADGSAYRSSKTYACVMEIQDGRLYLVRAESPGFPRPKSIQELRRGEICFVMTRIGEIPMTPEEVIQVAKETVFEKVDQTVRFQVASIHAPFVSGEPSDGHREGELHLDCQPDPHDFSRDQFMVVLTAECQNKLNSEGVKDITKYFLGQTIMATGPVRGVEYNDREMRGEHFHLIVDDPSKLIFDKSE